MELNQPVEQTSSKQADRYFARRGLFITVLIVVLSIISGALGGGLGVVYLSKQPDFQKFFNLQGSSSLTQRVSFNEENAVIDVVGKAGPAVVSVVISKDLSKYQQNNPFGLDPFFQFFGSVPQNQPTQPNIQQVGAGSGFFISSDGLILTNKHVVQDETASYSVVTSDGKSHDAKVLSRDPINDLALIKIDIQNAPKLDLADSSALKVGQMVIAIGNSLGQYQNTVTTGIVSGIGRSITAGGEGGSESLEGVIQTDAAINPGNSGGPLLNTAGQVIGINTAIDRQGQLVGFAIPANDANRAVTSFQKSGKITRPYLGVRYVMLNEAIAKEQNIKIDHGALILKGSAANEPAIISGGPADKAGLKENDVITKVDGQNVDPNHTLASLLRSKAVGDQVKLTVWRDGSEKDYTITLEEAK